MFNILRIVLIAGSIFLWGFGMWRSLRSEYEQEKILDLISAFWIGWFFGGGATYFLLYRQFGMTEWGGLLGAMWAVRRVVRHHDWDWWEWLDVLVPTTWGFAVLWYPIVNRHVLGLVMGGVAFVVWLFLLWMKASYRGFRWYKSGKMGLVGIFGLGLWAITQIVVAPIRPGELYWLGISISQVISGFVLSATMVNLYLRSGRKLKLS